MQGYTSEQLRNIVLMGRGGAGKTTLAEAMLFASDVISRMGSVDHGNTVSDFDEQEPLHHYSVQTVVVPVEWNGTRINLLDAHGGLVGDGVQNRGVAGTQAGHPGCASDHAGAAHASGDPYAVAIRR